MKYIDEWGDTYEAWFEVRRIVDGKHDVITTCHNTRKSAEKAKKEAETTGKYEVVYIEHLYENGVID